jgi:hypothetical protein
MTMLIILAKAWLRFHLTANRDLSTKMGAWLFDEKNFNHPIK